QLVLDGRAPAVDDEDARLRARAPPRAALARRALRGLHHAARTLPECARRGERGGSAGRREGSTRSAPRGLRVRGDGPILAAANGSEGWTTSRSTRRSAG